MSPLPRHYPEPQVFVENMLIDYEIYEYHWYDKKFTDKDWALISRDTLPYYAIYYKIFYNFCDYIVNFFITYSDFWDPVTSFFLMDFGFFVPTYITEKASGGASPYWGLDFLAGSVETAFLVVILNYIYIFTFTGFNFLVRIFFNSFNNFIYFDFDYLILFDSNIFSFLFFIYLGFFFFKSFFYILIYKSSIFFYIIFFLILYFLLYKRQDLLFSEKSFKLNFDYVLLLKEHFKKTKSFRFFHLKFKKYKK